ncbi:gamma-glutamyltransferase [Amycolatopsis sp. AA4]|uniref:gamma-glutamyltransferase n=1 Tax=Actinomycetes TaxID=1760 RepID=UPI0001B55071|nr:MULTISPECIES: gamma-glutamyltransferase [Actinomycetes]ATY12585.1 gamma-glutamyltransferase [Amycolatopsis sp. AA4]EFL08377.1 gamma-glutamyltransferase [Streptomyces sp. AA4]
MPVKRFFTATMATGLAAVCALGAAPAASAKPAPPPTPVAEGSGGAVVSDTVESTQAGIDVLRHGGTAADAAVAVAATLGVTDPYVAGLGGGGYFVYYDARTKTVSTIDGRETTPAGDSSSMFLDPATGKPYAFETAVESGRSVGVPGMLATWQRALQRWGKFSLADNLKPAEKVAQHGFVVTPEFERQTQSVAAKLAHFSPSAELFLPGGAAPKAGSVLRNPDLATTYRQIEREGIGAFYGGSVGRDLVRTVQNPPAAPGTASPLTGPMQLSDLRAYRALDGTPTHINYRGYDVYGMAPSSSGGITVGESLNILGNFPLSTMDQTQALHHYLEASRLAFADRNRYIGDARYVNVPQQQLLSKRFAASRACLIDPNKAGSSPVAPGDPYAPGPGCATAPAASSDSNEQHTNHFVVTDKQGNIVSYTNTIEQLAGSGITVPGRGFLLNNELTDFNFAPTQGSAPDPNLPAPGKRPRSSMSPTIVLHDGKPFLAVGSPGGATIITTVLQILVNRLDLGMTLPDAIAAPRASQRNAATTDAEPAFLALPVVQGLEALGQKFKNAGAIGVAAGIEFLPHGQLLAAGEPTRRGGTSAAVVDRKH